MQAFSIIQQAHRYDEDMQSGRPSNRPRTPFGEKLVATREVVGLSQQQVADALGITQHAYAYWERHPVALKPEQLSKLASVLHVNIDELIGENGNKKKGSGPSGKARRLFEAVSRLPRRQQEKIFSILEPFIERHGNGHKQAA